MRKLGNKAASAAKPTAKPVNTIRAIAKAKPAGKNLLTKAGQAAADAKQIAAAVKAGHVTKLPTKADKPVRVSGYLASRINGSKRDATAYAEPSTRDDTYLICWAQLAGGKAGTVTFARLAEIKRGMRDKNLSMPTDGTFSSNSVGDLGVINRLASAGRVNKSADHSGIVFTDKQASDARALAAKHAAIVKAFNATVAKATATA